MSTHTFLLNGAPVSLMGGWQFSPNVDAIEEFRILANTYDAQYGRTGSGTVITTLKSGGNSWHGGVSEALQNTSLNANGWFNNRDLPPDPATGKAPRNRVISNVFGGRRANATTRRERTPNVENV